MQPNSNRVNFQTFNKYGYHCITTREENQGWVFDWGAIPTLLSPSFCLFITAALLLLRDDATAISSSCAIVAIRQRMLGGVLGKASLKVSVLFTFSLQCCDGCKPHSWFQSLALSLAKETTPSSVSPSMQCNVPCLRQCLLSHSSTLEWSKVLLTGII